MRGDAPPKVTEIRLGESRFSKDLRRYRLARRLIGHEVRTSIISKWTGLTHNRIRSLWKAYSGTRANKLVPRHRGKPLRDLRFFLRSSQVQAESAAIAGLCMAAGLVPIKRTEKPRDPFPSVSCGETLCALFDLYCALSSNSDRPLLNMEQLILLVTALVRREELLLDTCEKCDGFVLRDRLATPHKRCIYCTTLLKAHADASSPQTGLIHQELRRTQSCSDN